MISLNQLRAARAMLGWSQTQCAKAAKVSLPALSQWERGKVTARPQSLLRLQQALETGGVEFLPQEGVRLRGEVFEFKKFEGRNIIDAVTRDMIQAVRHDGYCYVLSLNERMISDMSDTQDALYQQWVRRERIDERVIVPDDDDFTISRRSVCRKIARDMLGKLSITIYADRVAFFTFVKPYRAVIIRNPSLAATHRAHFLHFWQLARPLGPAKHATS